MSTYRLKDGRAVTDEQLEDMAREFESGEWDGHLDNVVVGLPKPTPDEMTVESFRIQRARAEAVSAATKRHGMTKSEFYRLAVDRELAALA